MVAGRLMGLTRRPCTGDQTRSAPDVEHGQTCECRGVGREQDAAG